MEATEIVELRRRIETALRDGDSDTAQALLARFEPWTPSADVLRATKIGLFMNVLRKNDAAAPDLRAKANALTRAWAKAVAGSSGADKPAKPSVARPPLPPARSFSSISTASADSRTHTTSSLLDIPSAVEPVASADIVPDPQFDRRLELRKSLGDKPRDMSVDIFTKALIVGIPDVDEKLVLWKARQIEDGLFKEFNGVSDKYKSQFRTLVSNLKLPDNLKLRADILSGRIPAFSMAKMTAQDLMSESAKLAKQEAEKFNNHWAATAKSTEAVTDEFKCGKCGQRKCTYYQKQTRSADEPMTTPARLGRRGGENIIVLRNLIFKRLKDTKVTSGKTLQESLLDERVSAAGRNVRAVDCRKHQESRGTQLQMHFAVADWEIFVECSGASAAAAATFLVDFERRVADARAAGDAASIAALEKSVSDAMTVAELKASRSAANSAKKSTFKFSSRAKKSVTPPEPPQNQTATDIQTAPEPVPTVQAEIAIPPNAIVFKDIKSATLRPSKKGESSSSTELYLVNISSCVVDLRMIAPFGAIHLKNVEDSVLVLGAVRGSVLADTVSTSVLVVACRQVRFCLNAIQIQAFPTNLFIHDQFRMHNSKSSRILLHVSSKPIIEDSDSLIFGPYTSATLLDSLNPTRETLPAAVVTWHELTFAAGLDDNEGCDGRWGHVEDFNWLRKTASPHWRRVTESAEEGGGEAKVDLRATVAAVVR
ncbi:RNA polymerase II elongation factor [Entophlyctis luteolus]|nr:RNA polymerase II elongation factor [Entophlyctis luteolus]